MSDPDLLLKAVRCLAAVCDGASARDGAGFNGVDSGFGRSLASLPDRQWTQGRREAAYRMIQKYRAQLAGHGIELSDIEDPRKTERDILAMPRLIELDDQDAGRAKLTFPFVYEIKEAVKASHGARWDAERKCWTLPLREAAAARALCADWGFEMSEDLHDKIENIEEQAEWSRTTSAAVTTDTELVVPGLGGELRPFQKVGVLYCATKKRSFLADDMGVGKTIQGLAVLSYLEAAPALVVCPASVKLNWAREGSKWLPGWNINVLQGPATGQKRSRSRPSLWIVNYELVGKYRPFLEQLGLAAIILDESHYIKNKTTARARACYALATGFDYDAMTPRKGSRASYKPTRKPIEVRLLLTGTPLLNRPAEIIHQLEFLDMLEPFGGWYKFVSRYCGATKKTVKWKLEGGQRVPDKQVMEVGGHSHLHELNTKLRELGYIRRLKRQVLPELPERQVSNVPLEISNRAEYRKAEKDLIEFVRKMAYENRKFRESIAHLDQREQERLLNRHANDKAERAARAKILVGISVLKQVAARGKLAAAAAWIQDILDTEQKLVMFGWHQEIVDAIAERFKCAAIKGGTPLADRQRHVDEFGQEGGPQLISLNMQAGGTGIDGLQGACSNVAFLELGWNDATHDQAISRIDRMGQRNAVNAWFLLGTDTIDDWVYELTVEKAGIFKSVADGAEDAADTPLMEELMSRFAAKV